MLLILYLLRFRINTVLLELSLVCSLSLHHEALRMPLHHSFAFASFRPVIWIISAVVRVFYILDSFIGILMIFAEGILFLMLISVMFTHPQLASFLSFYGFLIPPEESTGPTPSCFAKTTFL